MRSVVETFGYDQDELKKNLRVLDASDLDPLYGENIEQGRFKVQGAKIDFANLQRMVEAFEPQLVVIDGASDTFDGNEIARREVRAFIKMLRAIHPRRKLGVLLLVHIDRSSARGYSTNDDGYAGSAQWHNSCRRRMFLQLKIEKGDDGEVVSEAFVLRVMKNQDGAPDPDTELLRGDFGLWHPAVVLGGDFAPTTPPQDLSQRVAELIAEEYGRGRFLSTSVSANASTGAHAVLSSHPQWPKSLRKAKQTASVLMDLERRGILIKEAYSRGNRTRSERWKVNDSRPIESMAAQSGT